MTQRSVDSSLHWKLAYLNLTGFKTIGPGDADDASDDPLCPREPPNDGKFRSPMVTKAMPTMKNRRLYILFRSETNRKPIQ